MGYPHIISYTRTGLSNFLWAMGSGLIFADMAIGVSHLHKVPAFKNVAMENSFTILLRFCRLSRMVGRFYSLRTLNLRPLIFPLISWLSALSATLGWIAT